MKGYHRHCRRATRLALALALAPAAITAALADDAAPTPRLDGGGIGGAADASADDAANANDTGDAQTLPRLVVTGTREELREALSPGVVSVVYPDDVKGEHKSLPELLDQIPGVYVRRVSGIGQYTTASIRGSAPSQVNIYIDGVPFNLSSETAADLSTIPISNVERVEVYRGTTPARFSGAPIGGAINIVTKKPDGLHGSVSAGARSFEGRQGSTSMSAPTWGGNLLLGADMDRSKGDYEYKDLTVQSLHNAAPAFAAKGKSVYNYIAGSPWEPVNRERMNNSYEKDNFLAKWQNDNFDAKWSYTYMDRYMPSIVKPNINFQDHHQDSGLYTDSQAKNVQSRFRQRQGQHDLLLGWHDDFGPLTLGTNVTYLDQNKRYRALDTLRTQAPAANWANYHTRRYGVEGNGTYALGKDWWIDQLFEVHGDRYRETLHSSVSSQEQTSWIPTYQRDFTRVQTQDTFTLNFLDGLQITPIGRLERVAGPVINTMSDDDQGWKPTGEVSAKKKILDGWTLHGSLGTYNRYPNFYELYGDGVYIYPMSERALVTGARMADPPRREYGRNRDAGLGWNGNLIGDWSGSFDLTYFERRTDNAITLLGTNVGSKYVNGGNTYTHGGEFEGKIAYGNRADLQLAVTRQEGWYSKGGWYYFNGTGSWEQGQSRLLDTPLLVTDARLNLHFFGGDLTTFAEVKHTGRSFVGDGEQQFQYYLESLTTLDLGAHYKILEGLKLSSGVTDVFNSGPKQRLMPNLVKKTNVGSALKPNWVYYEVERNAYFPQQGRTFYGTLAWSF